MDSLIHKAARTQAINLSVQKLLKKSTSKATSFHLPIPSVEVVNIFINAHVIIIVVVVIVIIIINSTVVGSSFL